MWLYWQILAEEKGYSVTHVLHGGDVGCGHPFYGVSGGTGVSKVFDLPV